MLVNPRGALIVDEGSESGPIQLLALALQSADEVVPVPAL